MLNRRPTYDRIETMLRLSESQKDAAIVWLCQKLAEIDRQLSEIRSVANRPSQPS